MIISSWNVNSVRARIENIKEYLKKYSPEVLMMQEIKTEDINFPYDEFKNLKYESYVFGQKSYNGVAILSKKKLTLFSISFSNPKGVTDPGVMFKCSLRAASLAKDRLPSTSDLLSFFISTDCFSSQENKKYSFFLFFKKRFFV